jgi:hypothetical protein
VSDCEWTVKSIVGRNMRMCQRCGTFYATPWLEEQKNVGGARITATHVSAPFRSNGQLKIITQGVSSTGPAFSASNRPCS